VLVAPAHLDPERRRRAWLDADLQAPGRAGAFAVEAVALGGPVSLVDAGYTSVGQVLAAADDHGVELVGPLGTVALRRPRAD